MWPKYQYVLWYSIRHVWRSIPIRTKKLCYLCNGAFSFVLFANSENINIFAPRNKNKYFIIMNNYETVFILTPVLSDAQVEEAVKNSKTLLRTMVVKSLLKKTGDLRNWLTQSNWKERILYFDRIQRWRWCCS